MNQLWQFIRRLLEYSFGLLQAHAWKPFNELLQCCAIAEIVKQGSDRNSRARKAGRAAHDVGVLGDGGVHGLELLLGQIGLLNKIVHEATAYCMASQIKALLPTASLHVEIKALHKSVALRIIEASELKADMQAGDLNQGNATRLAGVPLDAERAAGKLDIGFAMRELPRRISHGGGEPA